MFAAEGGAAMKKQARGFAVKGGADGSKQSQTEYTQRDEQGD